jgi:hypothetical protein
MRGFILRCDSDLNWRFRNKIAVFGEFEPEVPRSGS